MKTISEKLAELEQESKQLRKIKFVSELEEISRECSQHDKEIILKAMDIIMNSTKEIQVLKTEVGKLHQQNVDDVKRIKDQIDKTKVRTKRPSTKIESVGDSVLRHDLE